jgi:hypothetical protein
MPKKSGKIKNNWGGSRPNSGGYREGSGRPKGTKLPKEKLMSKQINLRVTVAQWLEYLKRGGAKWLRGILQSVLFFYFVI